MILRECALSAQFVFNSVPFAFGTGIDVARFPLDLCWCGRVRGVASDVSPSSGFRFICYCKDCQAFARFLERPDVLDRAGGTDIFQMPAGRVKLTAGTDAVRCLRLSSEGVLRWYTTAASPGFPVIAVVHSFMAHAADGRSREEALGLPICRIYERSAVGPLPANAPAPPSLGVFARRASKIFGWWVLGLGRPSPLFDDHTNAPRAVPRVLTRSERAAL
jgi:hypothetical protein